MWRRPLDVSPRSAHRRPQQEGLDIEKLGRNDPCHCGSNKKYKKCHLAEDGAARSAKLAEENAKIAAAAKAEAEAEEAEADGEKGASATKAAKAKAKKKATAGGKKPAKPPPPARKQRRRGVA